MTINHIGSRGDGVGKVRYKHNYTEAEYSIFIPASLPGETLLAQPLSLTSQGIKARIIELHSVSPDRHTPRCNAFPACGGCRFQHWDRNFISNWKQDIVISFLNKENVNFGCIRPLYSSPPKSRRRVKFHLKCMTNGAIVGLNEHMGHHIISPKGCVVLHPALTALLPSIEKFAIENFIPGFSADIQINLLRSGVENNNETTGSVVARRTATNITARG